MSISNEFAERHFDDARQAGLDNLDERALRLCLRKINEDENHLATLLSSGDVVSTTAGYVLRPRRADGTHTLWAAQLLQRPAIKRYEVIRLVKQSFESHEAVAKAASNFPTANVIALNPLLQNSQKAVVQEKNSGKSLQEAVGTRVFEQFVEGTAKREAIKWRHPADSRSAG